jgi:hypothetical protein
MSPNELDLKSTLHEDAQRIDAIGDFATAAIGLERRRARRRTTVGAVAAAATLAIAAPQVWSNLGNDVRPVPATSTNVVDPTPSPTGSATPQPSVTQPTPAETTKPGPAPTADSNAKPKTTATIGTGAATGTPRVAYALDGVFHDGNRRVTLPTVTGLRSVARLAGDGVLIESSTDDGRATARFLDASGKEVAKATSQGFTVNEDGSRVAITDTTGTIRIYDAQGNVSATLRTGDQNARATGLWGTVLYYATVEASSGKSATRAWDTTGTSTRAVVDGSFADLHEGRGLAILWPNQDYDPGKTCYAVFDLKAEAVNYWSCGEFAPTQFTADGEMVFGPNVADGAGASNWKVASAADGSILMAVEAPDSVWAPDWRGVASADAVVMVPLSEGDSRQSIASCVVSTGDCTTDLDPVAVTTEDAQMMRWPITLSVN